MFWLSLAGFSLESMEIPRQSPSARFHPSYLLPVLEPTSRWSWVPCRHSGRTCAQSRQLRRRLHHDRYVDPSQVGTYAMPSFVSVHRGIQHLDPIQDGSQCLKEFRSSTVDLQSLARREAPQSVKVANRVEEAPSRITPEESALSPVEYQD